MATRRSLLGSSSSAIKSHNLRAILLILLAHQPVSRVRIARLTGLSTTTVTNLITELLAEGIVAEDGAEQPDEGRGVGRPRVALRLVPQARFAVGVHIGVGQVRVAITDLFARPLYLAEIEHSLAQPAERVLEAIAALIGEAIAASGVRPAQIVGVGVGASGLVDLARGVNVLAPNLGWREVPIRDLLAGCCGLPVFVDNNVRAMALAEALFGAGQNVRVLAFVYARIGVGAGFILDGQLYRGGAGAGEIGHMTLIAEGGEPCRCGNTGCLETLVSEPAFVRRAEALAVQQPGSLLAGAVSAPAEGPVIERLFAAARAGDPAALALLDERATYMGIGLANLVNTLSPELIILGGIFAQGADLLLPAVQQTLRERAFAGLGERVALRTPTFGQEAGVIGAAALALDAFFYEQTEGTF
jgi:predicted NBD/HSP70 family sugar kinase/biotin operon repressor